MSNIISFYNRDLKIGSLTYDDIKFIIDNEDDGVLEALSTISTKIKNEFCGNKVYIRAVIEFSNICKIKCKFCSMNVYNKNLERFLETKENITESLKLIKMEQIKTIMFQSGESKAAQNYVISNLANIDKEIIDNSILCIGDLDEKKIKTLINFGFKSYILKIETLNEKEYSKLKGVPLTYRLNSIRNLKEKNAKIGSGIILGLPNQSKKDIIESLLYIQRNRFPMCSVSPFIPSQNTELQNLPVGDFHLTLKILSVLRICNPTALIPSVSALNIINKDGQLKGLEFGANEITENFTNQNSRKHFEIYTKKRKITDTNKRASIIAKMNSSFTKENSTGIPYLKLNDVRQWFNYRYRDINKNLVKSVYHNTSEFFIHEFLDLINANDIGVDLGCGDGKYSIELARTIDHLTCIDRNEKALKRLKNRFDLKKINNYTLKNVDLFDENIFETKIYEIIVCGNLLHNIDLNYIIKLTKILNNISAKNSKIFISFETGINLKTENGSYFNVNNIYNHNIKRIIELFEEESFKLLSKHESEFNAVFPYLKNGEESFYEREGFNNELIFIR